MIEEFEIERINRAAATFDPAKLDWISNQHIKHMPVDRLAGELGRRLVEAGRLPAEAAAKPAWLRRLAEMVRPSLDRLDQVLERTAGLFHPGGAPATAEAAQLLRGAGARRVVQALAEAVERRPPTDAQSWASITAGLKESTGVKGKGLFQPIRIVLTGRHTGPELDRLVPLVCEGATLFPEQIVPLAERAKRAERWLA
jgi:glutamyl/glutaminyl-tRNA synthetase